MEGRDAVLTESDGFICKARFSAALRLRLGLEDIEILEFELLEVREPCRVNGLVGLNSGEKE